MMSRSTSQIVGDLREPVVKENIRRWLSRKGIPVDSVEWCPCDIENGLVVFRRRLQFGSLVKWHAHGVLEARTTFRNRLIGFAFADGDVRQDAEILAKSGLGSGFGGIVTPSYVLLWKKGAHPTIVADGMARLRQRPIVTVK